MLHRKHFCVPCSCQEFEHNDRVREEFGNYGAIHREKKGTMNKLVRDDSPLPTLEVDSQPVTSSSFHHLSE